MFKTKWSAAIAVLVGATLLLTPGTSEAQKGGGGSRGGGGGGGRASSGGGHPSSGANWSGNRGGQYRGGYGGGGYGLGFGLGYGWGSPYDDGGASPGYGYDTPAYPNQPMTIPRNSYYPSQSDNYPNAQTQLTYPNDAGCILRVPDPNAEVWFQDYKTQQRGTVRFYESSALDPNLTYTFSIRARWVQNGQQIDQTRQVQGRAGQNAMVDFTAPPRELIPTRPRISNPGDTPQPPNVLPPQQN